MSKIKIQELNSDKSAMVTLKPSEAVAVCGGYNSYSTDLVGGVSVGSNYYRPDLLGSYSI